MARLESSVVIDQPVEKVFEFVINPENDTLWQTQIQEAKVSSDGSFGVGSTTSQIAHFMGRRIETTAEITEFEQNRNFMWKSTSGPVPGTGQNIFEANGDGRTKFTVIADLEGGGFFKIAEPLFARFGRRQLEANLANLKDVLEADADSDD